MFSHSSHVMTLANSIIGVGILAMPFCFQKCGIVLAIFLLILSNWITRICCHFLIKTSLLTRRKSFEFLGFHAFGSSGKLLVELCIIGYLIGTCVTYFVVIGDLGPQIVTKMFHLNENHPHLRTLIMFIVTLICILPLGMLKNVDSLSTICTASIGFYVCLVMKIIFESGSHIEVGDWTEKVVYWEPAGVLQCLPIISMALSCQMQIFEVFSTINNQSVEKLNGIVKNATWICTCVYIAVGFFGYVAFCTQEFSGNILVNLAPSFSSDVIKIGFILSIAFSFPLVIFPCRASIYSLLYRKSQMDTSAYIPESRFKAITIFIVGFALCVALMIPSVELVIGLVGSTIGVAICIMFPASSFRKIILKNTTERHLAQLVLVGGFGLMILGTYANLNAIDEKQSGIHLDQPIDLKVKIDPAPELIENKILNFEKQLEKEYNELNVKNAIGIEIKTLEEQNLKESKIKEEGPKGQSPIPPLNEEDKPKEIKEFVKEIKEIPLEPSDPKKELPSIKANEGNEASILEGAGKDPLKPVAEKKINNILFGKLSSARSIDNEALKNHEEIAAEEQKDSERTNNDHLKETQKELKKTKELIERTVDEIKEELAKQNQETQNLVAEKINQMVEKVEAIERKVQSKDDIVNEIKMNQVNNQIAHSKEEILKENLIKSGKKENLKSPSKDSELNEIDKNINENLNDFQKENQQIQKINLENNEQKLAKADLNKVPPVNSIKIEEKPQAIVEKIEEIKSNLVKNEDSKLLHLEPSPIDLNLNQKKEDVTVKLELGAEPLKSNSSLLTKLIETPSFKSEEREAHAGVYEPLSYKAGEIIEQEKSKNQQRLPPPIALLFNSSLNKINGSLDPSQNAKDLGKPKVVEPKLVAYEQQAVVNEKLSNKSPDNQALPKLSQELLKDNDKEKENIEAIRRDLLQLGSKQLQKLDDTLSVNHNDSLRPKRDIHENSHVLNNNQEVMVKEICLPEPKIEDLMAAGSSLSLDLQKQTVGRHLKSVDENEE